MFIAVTVYSSVSIYKYRLRDWLDDALMHLPVVTIIIGHLAWKVADLKPET